MSRPMIPPEGCGCGCMLITIAIGISLLTYGYYAQNISAMLFGGGLILAGLAPLATPKG